MPHSLFEPQQRVRLKHPLHPVVQACCEKLEWDPSLTCMVISVDADNHIVTLISEEDASAWEINGVLELPEDYNEIELPEDCIEPALNAAYILN